MSLKILIVLWLILIWTTTTRRRRGSSFQWFCKPSVQNQLPITSDYCTCRRCTNHTHRGLAQTQPAKKKNKQTNFIENLFANISPSSRRPRVVSAANEQRAQLSMWSHAQPKKEREGAQALKPPNSKTERFLLSVDGDTALHHQMCWGLRRRNSYVLLEQT